MSDTRKEEQVATRKAFVYRLDIKYPEGSDEEDWEPEGEWWQYTWQYTRSGYSPDPADAEFSWPAEHLYLSASGADKRAYMLRKWGATVNVVRSKPVEWVTPSTSNTTEEEG